MTRTNQRPWSCGERSPAGSSFLLRGLLVCEPCGAPMTTDEGGVRTGPPATYHCGLGCGGTRIDAAQLDAQVLRTLRDLVLGPGCTGTLQAHRQARLGWLRSTTADRRAIVVHRVGRVIVRPTGDAIVHLRRPV